MAESTPPTQPATPSGRSATASRSATAQRATSANGTGVQTGPSTGVQAALEHVGQLKDTVNQFEEELQTYNDPNVVGRDAILLRSFCDHAVGRIMQISQSLKLNWTPPQNNGTFRGR